MIAIASIYQVEKISLSTSLDEGHCDMNHRGWPAAPRDCNVAVTVFPDHAGNGSSKTFFLVGTSAEEISASSTSTGGLVGTSGRSNF